MTNGEKAKMYSKEIRQLASINERFDNEPVEVQEMRLMYAEIFGALLAIKSVAQNADIAREVSIAITELQKSCMFGIKCTYEQAKDQLETELENDLGWDKKDPKYIPISDSNPLGVPMKNDGSGPM